MFKTTFFFPLFFLLWAIKHKAGHVAYILIKLSYLVPCFYSLLLESGVNCTQWSHRREKSLRINIDSGMNLFAGFISEEEGFPQENGGTPGVLALGRQPWVSLGKDEILGTWCHSGVIPSPSSWCFPWASSKRNLSCGCISTRAVPRRWGGSSSCPCDSQKHWSRGSLLEAGGP